MAKTRCNFFGSSWRGRIWHTTFTLRSLMRWCTLTNSLSGASTTPLRCVRSSASWFLRREGTESLCHNSLQQEILLEDQGSDIRARANPTDCQLRQLAPLSERVANDG